MNLDDVFSPLPPARKAEPDTRLPITTGDLCRLIDREMGVKLTVRFVCALGFTPVLKPSVLAGSGTYWRAADVPAIITGLQSHLASVYVKI